MLGITVDFRIVSEGIDATRMKEVKTQALLKDQKYTVLKNQENRTQQQQKKFEQMLKDNLLTAQAWRIRENFKYLFQHTQSVELHYKLWKEDALKRSIPAINSVIQTFDNHLKGIFNALQTNTSSVKHENMNGKIQAVIAQTRGFINFDRFRINTLFYFGNFKLVPQKIY